MVRRILFIECNEDGTVGGTHQVLHDLARHLDRTRYEPVLLYYQDNRFARALREQGFEVHLYEAERKGELDVRWHGGRLAKYADMVKGILRRRSFLLEHRIDAVHINNAPIVGNDDWLPAARMVGIPIVAFSTGAAVWTGGPVHRWLSRRFDRILPISDHMWRAMVANGVPPERLTMAPPGVDVDGIVKRVQRGRDEVRRELGVRDGQLLVTMVGNVRDWKGQHVLLHALGLLSQAERARLRVAFIGQVDEASRSYKESLDAIERELGLAAHVVWLGARSDVPDLFAAADLSVHCSVIPEPFGLVVTEAMALGTPVAATHFGGPAEVVTPDCGWLYDPERPEQLAAVLRSAIADPGMLTAKSDGARARAAQFSVGETVRKTQEAYELVFRSRASA